MINRLGQAVSERRIRDAFVRSPEAPLVAADAASLHAGPRTRLPALRFARAAPSDVAAESALTYQNKRRPTSDCRVEEPAASPARPRSRAGRGAQPTATPRVLNQLIVGSTHGPRQSGGLREVHRDGGGLQGARERWQRPATTTAASPSLNSSPISGGTARRQSTTHIVNPATLLA